MELASCAVIGRLTLPKRPAQPEGPSTYNISRLGLAPSVSPSGAHQAPASTGAPEHWPIVIAEPADPPARAQAHRVDGHGECARRKTSFALPADLLDQVRTRATVTHTFQYAVVAEALQCFFHTQVGALPAAQPGPKSLIACVRRVFNHILARNSRPR